MNKDINIIINKIIDLVPLTKFDIELIETFNNDDKLLIIKTYMETLNNVIHFMEECL
jgi:hypothetical protein